jgi:CDP-diacylglycerol---glycerol-3-phosphate 3-phosphatidyltransferase
MTLTIDAMASLALGGCTAALIATRAFRAARPSYGRVVQQGATFFLGANLMHAGYGMLQPVVRWCTRHGVSPGLITWYSLVPALAAAIAAGDGHWGLAAWCLLASALFDVLDGAVARASSQISPAGAVLDSVLDRYAEFFFFCGLFVYYRGWIAAQLVILAALFGSFLITYSTAKAEALQLTPPRGSMKRSDRLTVLILGNALAPLSPAWLETSRQAWPVLAAAALIALGANASALRRFAALSRATRCPPASAAAEHSFGDRPTSRRKTAAPGDARPPEIEPSLRIQP